jgi:UDP-glucose:(heptosyl)LPS alpha-1,3-glucosyltransferase
MIACCFSARRLTSSRSTARRTSSPCRRSTIPFPNAALEALACGLPLLTTTTCGAAELITAANGAVITAGDVAALAANLDSLCAQAPAMRDAARASVAHLELSPMAAQLVALYSRLA